MWVDFFDNIYLVNLVKRTDRLLQSVEHLDEYDIPYTLFNAVEKENGAEGLRDTMNLIFEDAIQNNYSNILVLEDDCLFITEKIWVDETMKNVVKELPENYWLCYLGGQATGGFQNFYTSHLLPVIKFFSTHAVMYSKQGIKEILSINLGFPIDNWICENIQTQGNCYCTYPMLASQRPGVSDIGKEFIDWRPFMDIRFNQKINELNARR